MCNINFSHLSLYFVDEVSERVIEVLSRGLLEETFSSLSSPTILESSSPILLKRDYNENIVSLLSTSSVGNFMGDIVMSPSIYNLTIILWIFNCFIMALVYFVYRILFIMIL